MLYEEHENVSEIEQRISAFISSLDAYQVIADAIPINNELNFFECNNEVEATFSSIENILVAIDVRLMLQRKYFSNNENVNTKKLLKKVTEAHPERSNQIEVLLQRLEEVNSSTIMLAMSDGTCFSNKYEVAEKIIYGFYLHADVDKIKLIMNLSPQMKFMAITPYVIEREKLLFSIRSLLISLGYHPFFPKHAVKAGVMSLDDQLSEKKDIVSSPYWSNFLGHDASDEELSTIVSKNTVDDNIVLFVGSTFFKMLQDDHFNPNILRQIVWNDFWDKWGDFSEGHVVATSIPSPGISSKVMHEGGDGFAQIKILPNVKNPWITSTPQFIQAKVIMISLMNRKGVWKIIGMQCLSVE